MPKKRPSKGRKAWLVTWEGVGGHVDLPKDPIVAILDSRRNPRFVKEFIELLYGVENYTSVEKFDHLQGGPPYPAQFNALTRTVGEETITARWEGQIVCGHNPYLYARIVRNLRKDPETGQLTWEAIRPNDLSEGGRSR